MPNGSRPRTYLADSVYVALRRALVAGDFHPGEPLTEGELCRRFAVSRTPVREALAKLERDQLVRVVPKKGAFVRSLSHAEIRELYQLREALEALVVRLAAPRADRAELDDFARRFRELRARRNVLVDGLNAIPGVVCARPKGAFYCVAELPIDDADAFCQWLLEKFVHKGHTVMMAPATGFYAEPGPGRKQVRLAYVLERDKLRLAVECLEEALRAYPGSTAKATAAKASA